MTERISDQYHRTYKIGMTGRTGAGTGKVAYGIATLMGNWSEEQWDSRPLEPRPLLRSEAEKMYQTTYSATIAPKSTIRGKAVYEGDEKQMLDVWNGKGRVFPGHQPEVDPHVTNHTYEQWKTENVNAYAKPDAVSREPRTFCGGKAVTKETRMANILTKIRQRVVARAKNSGDGGFRGIRRMLKIMDVTGDNRLNIRELQRGFKTYRIDVSDLELQTVFNFFDRDNSGEIDLKELLRAMRGDMNEGRLRFVQKAYKLLDKNKDGEVTLEDIRQLYDVSQHPDVKSGKRAPDDVLREYMRGWDRNGDDNITLDEFVEYYTDVSAEIDHDSYFELMMRNTWHISGGEGASANTSCRRVLVVHENGRQTVEEIKDDLGIGPNDIDKMRENLISQGITDIAKIELKGAV